MVSEVLSIIVKAGNMFVCRQTWCYRRCWEFSIWIRKHQEKNVILGLAWASETLKPTYSKWQTSSNATPTLTRSHLLTVPPPISLWAIYFQTKFVPRLNLYLSASQSRTENDSHTSVPDGYGLFQFLKWSDTVFLHNLCTTLGKQYLYFMVCLIIVIRKGSL